MRIQPLLWMYIRRHIDAKNYRRVPMHFVVETRTLGEQDA
jgi:hypothetical protein